MEKVKKMLQVREKVLLKIKKEKEKSLQRVPEGGLRICCKGNKPQFYHRTDPKDYNGRYIQGKEYKLVQKLAQKDYDEKVLRVVEKELRAIERYFALSPKISVEEVYYGLHKERQKLVVSVQEPQEEFIKNWEKKEYEGKTFFTGCPEYYTAKGE